MPFFCTFDSLGTGEYFRWTPSAKRGDALFRKTAPDYAETVATHGLISGRRIPEDERRSLRVQPIPADDPAVLRLAAAVAPEPKAPRYTVDAAHPDAIFIKRDGEPIARVEALGNPLHRAALAVRMVFLLNQHGEG